MIEVKNVSKSFKKEMVVKNVTASFRNGTITGIIGHNGSGKTLLLKMISGLLIPSEGEIYVDSKQVGKDMDFPDSMGLIIENPGFIGYQSAMTNLENLAVLKNKIGKEEIRKAIESVGLDPDSKKFVGKYSLGMRQRLGIAQAIMENPDILLLDEPMNGLDKSGVADIREILLKCKSEGKTIIICSHNKDDIDILCDVVYEMDNGVLTLQEKK